MEGYEVHEVVTLVWTDEAVGDGAAPDTDTKIDLRQVEDLIIQVDTTAAGHTAASIDVGAIFSPDADPSATGNWDTIVTNLGITAFADNKVQSFHITSFKGGWMKLRLDVNDNVGNVTIRLRKRTRRS